MVYFKIVLLMYSAPVKIATKDNLAEVWDINPLQETVKFPNTSEMNNVCF
jgi:hypothetical protein